MGSFRVQEGLREVKMCSRESKRITRVMGEEIGY